MTVFWLVFWWALGAACVLASWSAARAPSRRRRVEARACFCLDRPAVAPSLDDGGSSGGLADQDLRREILRREIIGALDGVRDDLTSSEVADMVSELLSMVER